MIDGKWELTSMTPLGKKTSTLEVKVVDGKVVGTRTDGYGTKDIEDAVLNGNELTYGFVSTSTMGENNANATLTFDGDKVTGKAKVKFGTFNIEGYRVT